MINQIALKYFEEHPQEKDDVMKAYFAYHAKPFDDERAHSFTSGARESKCIWCMRSREEVRFDDFEAHCSRRPKDIPIRDVLLNEEESYFKLLDSAERIIPKIVAKLGVSGDTLAYLHHTHGFDPEVTASIIEVNEKIISEYNAAMEVERERSRRAQKREVITALPS